MRVQGVGRRLDISTGVSVVASVAVGAALGLTLTMVSPPRLVETPGAITPSGTALKPLTSGSGALHPGLLVDLRDEALRRLLHAPADLEAMDSLVRIQRYLAADNPKVLRVHAEGYARAVRAGGQSFEHLSPRAMRLLVLANLLGATQIESQPMVRRR